MEKDNLGLFETMAQMASNHEPPVFLWATIWPLYSDIIENWLPDKPFTEFGEYFDHYAWLFKSLEDYMLFNEPDIYMIYKNSLEYMGLSDLHKLLFACLSQYDGEHSRKLMAE